MMNLSAAHQAGYCVVCGCDASFQFDTTIITPELKKAWGISDALAEAFNRKESLFCSNCGASLRVRRLAAVLMQTFGQISGRSYHCVTELVRDEEFQRLKIAEINDCGALHSVLEPQANLHFSRYVREVRPGETHRGVRCEDLQCLTYPDDYFDIILTSETLEHVPDPEKAWREIYRTLKSGGYHIFTIPVIPWQRSTTHRARLVNGVRRDLLAPAYHGVWGQEDMFVYTDFGMDFIEILGGMGLSTEAFYLKPEDQLDVAVVFRSQKTARHLPTPSTERKKMLENTGERYLPWIEDASLGYEHLHRYAYAAQFAQNKNVLDLASGEGYGSHLLAQTAKFVVGIDIDESAIKHAKNKYLRSNLEFRLGSITDIPVDGEHIFDAIVCFEALEHIADHAKLLQEVKRLLASEGVFIVSTPNKMAYSDEPQLSNPFHVRELYLDEFKEILGRYFEHVKIMGQRIYCDSNIWPLFSPSQSLTEYVIEKGSNQFSFVDKDRRVPMYFLALASATEAATNESASVLIDHSNQLLKERDIALNRVVAARDAVETSLKSEREASRDQKDRIVQLSEEKVRLAGDMTQLQTAMQTQQRTLEEKNEQVVRMAVERDELVQEIKSVQVVLQQKETQVVQLAAERDHYAQSELQLRTALQTQQRTLEERNQQVNQMAAERNHFAQSALDLQGAVRAERQARADIQSTIGWKVLDVYRRARDSWSALAVFHSVLTAPIKKLFGVRGRGQFASSTKGRSFAERTLRSAYRKLPVSDFNKKRLKSFMYRKFGLVFKQTASYQLWQIQENSLREFVGVPFQLPRPPTVELPATFEFRDIAEPIVSIIIPVFNHIEFTYKCLKAIHDNPSQHSYEIIVVDDASNDETQKVLAPIKGVRLIRNDKNLGFVHSCNKGAAVARGNYLWFLNNDTLVMHNSLDALVDTFRQIPNVGLAGSKLIYPDGKLQEAGGIIWNDASGWNFGRGDTADRPEYSYSREVDYCSGASIMIPKSLFDELGGFDAQYAPAYYEDVDLAFKVRRAGRKVWYQSLSQIVHDEGVSSGTDVSVGIKSFQETNRIKLYDTWKGVIRTYGEPGIDPHHARDRYATRRVLMVDACTPTPDRDAGSTIVCDYVKILASRGDKVTFIPADNFLFMDPYTVNLQRLGVECLYAPYVTNVASHLETHGREYDVIVLFRVHFAAKYIDLMRKFCPQAVQIFNPIDLHYLREERQAVIEGSDEIAEQARRTKTLELETVRKVDGTIVVSETEREILNREVPGASVTTIPILFDVKGNRTNFAHRKDMFFLGGYQHKPNVDAVIYFVRSIWPWVKESLPEAKFYVLGADAPSEIRSLTSDDVVVVGYVEDLSTYLDRCRISIVPLRYGAGMKGKIGTSMSYGVPCVATSIATEGLGLSDGENILVGDRAEDFAEKVVRLYSDNRLWEQLSSNGLSWVESRWSMKAGERMLLEYFDHLQNQTRRCDISDEFYNGQPKLILTTIRSGGEYRTHAESMRDEYIRREQMELALITNDREFWTPGYCFVCQENTSFRTSFEYASTRQDGKITPNWREQLTCSRCGLNNRLRASIQIFQMLCHPSSNDAIYVTEQTTPLYAWVKNRYPKTIGSEYLGIEIPFGQINVSNIRNEDMTRLSFADGQFDHLLSFDVLEHVPDFQKAVRECFRCLKPNGTLLFGVPFNQNSETNIVRARVNAQGKVEHLLTPEYHGDPVNPQGVLCFYHFGWELLDQLRAIGFHSAVSLVYWSKELGYLGGEQMIFLAQKG